MVDHGFNKREKRKEMYHKRMAKKREEEEKRRRMRLAQSASPGSVVPVEEEQEYDTAAVSEEGEGPVALASAGISRDRLYNLMKRLEVRSTTTIYTTWNDRETTASSGTAANTARRRPKGSVYLVTVEGRTDAAARCLLY